MGLWDFPGYDPISAQGISIQQIIASLPTPFNLIAGVGVNDATAGIGTGTDVSAGVYYNPVTSESGSFKSLPCGSQSGFGAMAGWFVGFIVGDAYFDGSGNFVGESIGHGPGVGFTSTKTNTMTFPLH